MDAVLGCCVLHDQVLEQGLQLALDRPRSPPTCVSGEVVALRKTGGGLRNRAPAVRHGNHGGAVREGTLGAVEGHHEDGALTDCAGAERQVDAHNVGGVGGGPARGGEALLVDS